MDYKDLDNDVEELTRNLMQMNEKNVLKAHEAIGKPTRAEKKLRKSVGKFRKGKK